MFSWADFLAFSKKLNQSTDEAEQRTAIGRAYYSVFHQAEDFCQISNIAIPSSVRRHAMSTKLETSKHLRVISALRNHRDLRIKYAGRLLDGLRTSRDDADYKLIFPHDINTAHTTATLQADEILTNFDKFLRNIP